MSGAEFTKSMSVPRGPGTDKQFHYLKRWDNLKPFSKAFRKEGSVSLEYMQLSKEDREEGQIVFDLVGVDCSIANALRRVMLNDVQTMAIEKVMFMQNTGVMQDEKLAHRLGLIPILADAAEFSDRPDVTGNTDATDQDTLVFELDVECTAKDVAKHKNERFINIYSSSLRWVPHGSQAERFKGREPKPVHKDILITRLGVGQKITATLFAQKGSGFEHAKWQPVTAFYRQLPVVELLQDVVGEEATEWKKTDVSNIFDLVDDADTGSKKLKVARPRNCTMAKNFYLLPGGREKVSIDRKEDHAIFTVEPIGQVPAREVLLRGIAELKRKAASCLEGLDQLDLDIGE